MNLFPYFTVKTVKMEDSNLGAFIKIHRKEAGLTQLQLADLAGIGKTTVFDIEKNKESIRWDNLKSVMKVLNIDIRLISPLTNKL